MDVTVAAMLVVYCCRLRVWRWSTSLWTDPLRSCCHSCVSTTALSVWSLRATTSLCMTASLTLAQVCYPHIILNWCSLLIWMFISTDEKIGYSKHIPLDYGCGRCVFYKQVLCELDSNRTNMHRCSIMNTPPSTTSTSKYINSYVGCIENCKKIILWLILRVCGMHFKFFFVDIPYSTSFISINKPCVLQTISVTCNFLMLAWWAIVLNETVLQACCWTGHQNIPKRPGQRTRPGDKPPTL